MTRRWQPAVVFSPILLKLELPSPNLVVRLTNEGLMGLVVRLDRAAGLRR
jgi:hypothetical protein